jgi:hypothetical protein
MGEGTQSAMVMMARSGRFAVAAAILRSGVTDFARHGERRPAVAARKSDASVRRKNEGQGLQKEQANDSVRDELARRFPRCQPNVAHACTGKLLKTLSVNKAVGYSVNILGLSRERASDAQGS